MSFQVLEIVRRGLFKNRVLIEVAESAMIETVKFRTNAVGMSVVANHEIFHFSTGDRFIAHVPKRFEIGDKINRADISQALSTQNWKLLIPLNGER